MQSRWDSKSSINLQQQIKTALDLIIARHNYYISAKANMLNLQRRNRESFPQFAGPSYEFQ